MKCLYAALALTWCLVFTLGYDPPKEQAPVIMVLAVFNVGWNLAMLVFTNAPACRAEAREEST